MGKLVLAATVYHLWKERNSRLFRNKYLEGKEVFKGIIEEVRLNFFSLNPNFFGTDIELKRIWHTPKVFNNGKNANDG